MDYLTFISNIIGDIIWPVIVLIIVCCFRSSISELMSRIESFERNENGFIARMKNAESKIKDLPPGKVPEDVKILVHDAPIEAVKKSWKNLHESASEAVHLSNNESVVKIADALCSEHMLSFSEASAFHELSKINYEVKNGVLHLTDDGSSDYASMAYTLLDKVKEKSDPS